MKDFAIKKIYYSISEVSNMTGVKPYVLRYWESEFPELKPSKNRAGKRIYRSHDIEVVLAIKKLLYDEKYTIEGAKSHVRELSKSNEDGESELPVDDLKKRAIVNEIRRSLQDILRLLNSEQTDNHK